MPIVSQLTAVLLFLYAVPYVHGSSGRELSNEELCQSSENPGILLSGFLAQDTLNSGTGNDQVEPSVFPAIEVSKSVDIPVPTSSSEGSSANEYVSLSIASQEDCNAADAIFTANFTALLQTPTVEAAGAAREAFNDAKSNCKLLTSTRTGIDGNPISFQVFYSKEYKQWQDEFISFYVQKIASMIPDDLKNYDFSTPLGSLADSKADMIALLRKEVETAWETYMSTPTDDSLKQSALRMTGNWQALVSTNFHIEFEESLILKLAPKVRHALCKQRKPHSKFIFCKFFLPFKLLLHI